ncbi:type III secretion system translocon subunit SctE [Vibrio sp. Of14-4]|uniref:type III secretion system translocon subunit SctE n=1 Tax=Vibrio sp. Of14-4 TaxID=2724878 RepID=UPI001EF3A28E|nr:type III secretion system translocon subunit SctE [Vibrio sp. Of14-4]MCG7490146.1 type III secretion system translocon subunit SctE [Vibrio sp. Of14-4]
MSSNINIDNNFAVQPSFDLGGVDSPKIRARLPDSRSFTQLEHTPNKGQLVSLEEANQALERVTNQKVSVSHIEHASMSDIALLVASIGIEVFTDTAKALAKSSQLKTDTQAVLNDKRVKEFQEQLAKHIEQSEKAHKGGIFGAIFDWIVGAVEAVIGVFKLIEGAARIAVGDVVGGAMDMASGGAYLTAGIAGMVKAAAETAILCGADKEKCQQVIDVAGKVQLGAEVVGMALDIFQAGRAISATRSIAKGTETAMTEAAPKLVESIGKGSTSEVANIAQQIGSQVSEQVSEQVAEQLMKGATQAIEQVAEQGGHIAQSLTEAFSKSAIEKFVSQAVEKVAVSAMEKGGQVTAEQITKEAVKAVRNEVISRAIKACTYTSLELIRASAGAGKAITNGVITIEKAKLQKQIEDLIIKQNFMEFCYDWLGENKKQVNERNRSELAKAGEAVDGATKVINESAMLQTRIINASV